LSLRRVGGGEPWLPTCCLPDLASSLPRVPILGRAKATPSRPKALHFVPGLEEPFPSSQWCPALFFGFIRRPFHLPFACFFRTASFAVLPDGNSFLLLTFSSLSIASSEIEHRGLVFLGLHCRSFDPPVPVHLYFFPSLPLFFVLKDALCPFWFRPGPGLSFFFLFLTGRLLPLLILPIGAST